jgi:hypothetical protein
MEGAGGLGVGREDFSPRRKARKEEHGMRYILVIAIYGMRYYYMRV